MPAEKIVVNASPLILLFNSDLSFILPQMFKEILIPDAVWKEIVNSSYLDKASKMLANTYWIRKTIVETANEVVKWDLGPGETDVLSFAFINRDYSAMVDDRAAQKCGLSLGIKTLGTGAVLILAKEKGIISSVENSLMKLRDAGMWISESIIKLLMKKAGE